MISKKFGNAIANIYTHTEGAIYDFICFLVYEVSFFEWASSGVHRRETVLTLSTGLNPAN